MKASKKKKHQASNSCLPLLSVSLLSGIWFCATERFCTVRMATILSKPQLRAVTLSKRLPILPRTCSCQSRFTLQQYQCISTGRMTPKIADASMWNSVIPKFLRSGSQKGPKQGADAGIMERHPSVFYILMFILIGSQAIHLLQLRTSHENFLRSTNSKIRQLSEVIDRLKNGEDVDVRKTLGTGNKASEDEWEEGSYTTVISL